VKVDASVYTIYSQSEPYLYYFVHSFNSSYIFYINDRGNYVFNLIIFYIQIIWNEIREIHIPKIGLTYGKVLNQDKGILSSYKVDDKTLMVEAFFPHFG
jgi:hypothetical protein